MDKVIELRKQGLGYKTIAKRTGLSRNDVKKICLNNGLDTEVAFEFRFNKREYEFSKKFNVTFEGEFEYHSGFSNTDSHFLILCKKCNKIFSRSAKIMRKKNKNIKCDHCAFEEKRDKQLMLERDRLLKNSAKLTSCLRMVYINQCVRCRELFASDKEKNFCSRRCGKRERDARYLHEKRLKRLNRVSEHKADKDISLSKLYKRDKGVCYICKEKCDYDSHTMVNGTFIIDDKYPTVEHVVPISKGGSHTWDNVKLACFRCNTKKGSTI
ncbi:MAG: HNH endonuclease [Vagococcus sp.]